MFTVSDQLNLNRKSRDDVVDKLISGMVIPLSSLAAIVLLLSIAIHSLFVVGIALTFFSLLASVLVLGSVMVDYRLTENQIKSDAGMI